jgi:peptide/nickel transport system substrate-binding protein
VRQRRGSALLCLLFSFVLVAAACSSDKKSTGAASSSSETPTEGGDLVFGAEQEGDCMDWIASCAGASWGVYTMQAQTMPRSFDFNLDKDGKGVYTPSLILTGEPKLTASPTQTVEYDISPTAVWSDGEPITSHDYKYTWQQIASCQDVYDATGYKDCSNGGAPEIANVDDTDPKKAIVTWTKPFAAWRDQFGGFYGIYPSHLLEGKDRAAIMKDGYTFSAGPWMLDHWTKGVETKLVPNPKYFGKKPHLSSITWKLITDTAAQQQAIKSGQVSAVYPQAQPGQEALKGLPGLKFDAVTSLSDEAVWFNTSAKPLDSVKVRQALAFATDRDAIVNQLFAPVQPDIKPIQSLATPTFGDAYTESFSKYKKDLTQVTTLMTGDGWAKDGSGIWAKGGETAKIEIKTTTNNKRRELTLQILQSQWKEAGFDVTLTLEKSSVLFGQDGPQGNFQAALFAQVPPSNDPSQCSLWCSKNIPTAANGNSGTNWYRINDPQLDEFFTLTDTEFDTAKRVDAFHKGQDRLAELVPALPLDPFPDIIVYSDKIGGPVGHNPSFGLWYNVNEWFLRK